jgi:hypothetical protein
MVAFLSELLSVLVGKRKLEDEPLKHSSKPESSPAKRLRQDQMPNGQETIVAVNGEPSAAPKQQLAPLPAVQQQQQQQQTQQQAQQERPVLQQPQQQRQSLHQPSRQHLGGAKQRPMNNAFRQLHTDAQRAAQSPAFAGGSQSRVSSTAYDSKLAWHRCA